MCWSLDSNFKYKKDKKRERVPSFYFVKEQIEVNCILKKGSKQLKAFPLFSYFSFLSIQVLPGKLKKNGEIKF